MGSRPTIADVADAAGVSVATVDRVLNGRHRVREETARRVYEAAGAIGYHATALIRRRLTADLPEMTFGFILQKEQQAFYQAFAREISAAVEAVPGVRAHARTVFVEEQTPEQVVAMLDTLGHRCDAIAMTSLDHHTVTDAVTALKAEGTPVFSILSDFAQGVRESYIGLNNIKVGRTAAWFIARTAKRAGKVGLFVGSHRWHGHELRETGFRSFFRTQAPDFQLLETLINMETRQVTYEATLSLIERHPDIAGFYVAGGGVEGALRAVREITEPDRRPVVIANELMPDRLSALREEVATAVIGTPLPRLCAILVKMMKTVVLDGSAATPGQIFLPFDLHVSESV